MLALLYIGESRVVPPPIALVLGLGLAHKRKGIYRVHCSLRLPPDRDLERETIIRSPGVPLGCSLPSDVSLLLSFPALGGVSLSRAHDVRTFSICHLL